MSDNHKWIMVGSEATLYECSLCNVVKWIIYGKTLYGFADDPPEFFEKQFIHCKKRKNIFDIL